MTISLLQICIDAVARLLPLVDLSPAACPDEGLALQLYETYMRLDQARRRLPTYSPALHLAALKKFATFWQPSVLSLTLPSVTSQPGRCDQLQGFADSLLHLELRCPSAWLSGLSGLHSLTCLSLRHCPSLTTAAIQTALQDLPQLSALDLCGLSAVSDALAPTLVGLSNLLVLQLNRTSCSDSTVEWLTYGQRMHDWQATQQLAVVDGHSSRGQDVQHCVAVQAAAGAVAATPSGAGPPQQAPHAQLQGAGNDAGVQQNWPRTKIRQWHLAYTRVTPRAVELLASLQDIVFLDLRGSGVRAVQLVPLRTKFALSAVQGAVLSRTAAMAAAAVAYEQFVCAAPAEHLQHILPMLHAAPVTGPQVAGFDAGVHRWVSQGIQALLQAAAEASTGVQQLPGVSGYAHAQQ